MARPRIILEETRDAIRHKYQNGATIAALRREFPFAEKTIRTICADLIKARQERIRSAIKGDVGEV